LTVLQKSLLQILPHTIASGLYDTLTLTRSTFFETTLCFLSRKYHVWPPHS